MRTRQGVSAGVAVIVTMLLAATAARADVITVPVPAAAIERHGSEDGSAYYVVPLDLPAGVQSVREAWLELRMDVSSVSVEGFSDPAPMLEVYALAEAFTGAISPEVFVQTRLPMSRPVAVGRSRTVKIDVTEALQRMTAATLPNHGLVVGAITKGNGGDFALSDPANSVTLVLDTGMIDE